MKKFLLLIFAVLNLSNVGFTQEATPIDFVYIHGSDQGTVEEFDIWINRMHPNMKKNLEANGFVKEHLLKNAYIKEDKDMLYWADRTLKDKSVVEMGLTISKLVSSCIAQFTRTTLAHLLHDAIWLQKYTNMTPILTELNNKVIENSKKGEQTILVGYSAGTFITYQYALRKVRTFNLLDFAQKFQGALNLDSSDITALKNTKPENTCIDAIVDSNIAVLSATGDLIPLSNKKQLRSNFSKLKTQTELSCAPKNSISGIINFGSPIVIFYSDNVDEDSQAFYFGAKLIQYMVENNKFALTVNYKTDPLGVPMENITKSELEEYDEYKNIKFNGGFVYDTSVKGGIMFVSSHLKYWDQTNHFTKAVARSYEEGYKKFYGISN